MWRRGGAVVGVAVSACTLAGCSADPWESETYVFTAPFTGYDGIDLTKRVLVRDGVVTDVWVTPEARDARMYGFTPELPPDRASREGMERTDLGGGAMLFCTDRGTELEDCARYEDVHALADSDANVLAAWDRPADGELVMTEFSAVWDLSTTWLVRLEGGEIVAAEQTDGDPSDYPPTGSTAFGPGSKAAYRVTYWVTGEDAPFARCYDDPNSYDEEHCWEWGE